MNPASPALPASGPVVLVAMPRSGETFLMRDAAGTLWLFPPEGAGQPKVVGESAIDDAVRRNDWGRIDAEFDSREALDADRQRRAAQLAPGRDIGIADYDAEDVQRILAGARNSIDEGDTEVARTMLNRLLSEVRLVQNDSGLRDEIVALLASAKQSTTYECRDDHGDDRTRVPHTHVRRERSRQTEEQ
jgi:hypothetical protein